LPSGAAPAGLALGAEGVWVGAEEAGCGAADSGVADEVASVITSP